MSTNNQPWTSLDSPPMQPILDPTLAKDLAAWEAAKGAIADIQAKIKKLLLALTTGDVFANIIQLMSLMSDEAGAQISAFSKLDKLDTDLRDDLSSAQSSFNNLLSGTSKDPTGDAQNIIDKINSVQNFIKYEQSLPEDERAVDGATLDTLQKAVTQIENGFSHSGSMPNQPPIDDWGNAQQMAQDAKNWLFQSGNGNSVPNVKNILDGFNTLNQSVSALSSTTNTQLQYTGQQYQQYIGEMKTDMDAYSTLTSAMVKNQRAGS